MNIIRPGDPRYLPVDTSYAESRKLFDAMKAAHKEWLEETEQKLKMFEIEDAFNDAQFSDKSIKIKL